MSPYGNLDAPPHPEKGGGRRVTSVKRHYSIKLQLSAAERAPLDRLPTCQSRDPVRFKGAEVTPSASPGAGGRALITLRQVYLESAPEKEQRREDDRFFTGGTFLFLARGHSGRTTNTAELKKKKSVCSERLVNTLDRLQTRVTSACTQPSQSQRFDNMLLNVNYSSSRWEEKQICRWWIL